MTRRRYQWAGRVAAAALLAFSVAACGGRGESVRFGRLEHVLSETPAAELPAALAAWQKEHATPLLNVDPTNPSLMQMMAEFVQDPGARTIYRATDSLYADLGSVEKELGKALAKAEKLCPDMHYDNFVTLVTTDLDDYPNRVFCNSHELALSIDHYAVGCFPGAVPAYIERVSRQEYIAADCMAAIARAHIALPEGELTLLDYAIAEGKTLYFLERTMPSTPDTIRLRYTAEQLRWAKANTENVWAWLLQNKMLYSKDMQQFHNLIDDAPKTNAFGDGSAPRTAAYIGWQIVRRYMKKSSSTMQQLFERTDSQGILSESGWRP